MAGILREKVYPKQDWRWATRRRFVPLKALFKYRGGIRSKGGIVWPKPHYLSKYVAVLFRREKHVNWFAQRDSSRRADRRHAEGRKNNFPNCPKNFWEFPYS